MAVRRASAPGILEQQTRHSWRPGRDRFVRVDRNHSSLYAWRLGCFCWRISCDDRHRRFPDEGRRSLGCIVLSAEAGPPESEIFCGANEPGFDHRTSSGVESRADGAAYGVTLDTKARYEANQFGEDRRGLLDGGVESTKSGRGGSSTITGSRQLL